ncbi:hypothetical protein P171DRAFT_492553 [Karstenula rhodostoma CBS 690.94]|uniref:Azaphilone pigments biosynthesis cluster protein L N-terminal domain-containing protein n=1 Tax=Karstenula rhodostoma CBS 690.94 TaxID=1392251 RepID=A0A9P4UI36_9PLEO|nr:hypothetical protein P171DRAFT_492553 [Karstenula rhodostoma CBS 690.94]
MGDPLSTISGVLAVTTAAIQSTKFLIDTINGIKDAPKVVKEIGDDLQALKSVLEELFAAMKGPKPPVLRRGGVEGALKHCDQYCTAFGQLLSKWSNETTGDKMSLLTRLKVYFGEDKIEGFREKLRDTKLTLNLALGAATVLTIAQNPDMKDVKDGLLKTREATIVEGKVKAETELNTIEQCLERLPRAEPEKDKSDEEEIDKLNERRISKQLLINMSDEALAELVFARTGQEQTIKGTKATNAGFAYAGNRNAPAGWTGTRKQNISETTADGSGSVAFAGNSWGDVDIMDQRSRAEK